MAIQRIGVLGLTHDHIWSNLDELQKAERGQLVAVADAHHELRSRAAAAYQCATHESADAMLDRESLDAVYVYGDNAAGVEHTIAAAERGLHAMVEKPLAASLEGGQRMVAAATAGQTQLMINWPFAWWPQLQQALTMALAGDIGHVWQVKYRAAHAGPKELGCSDFFCDWLFDTERNGGGALMDYCCYGAVLSQYVLGNPTSITAVAGRLTKTALSVEDNAVVIMSYPRAISVSEGSWSHVGNIGNYTTLIFGSEGTLMVEPREDGRLLKATEQDPEGIEVPCERRYGPNASEHFLDCLVNGLQLYGLVRAEPALGAQAILSAAIESAQSGQTVSL